LDGLKLVLQLGRRRETQEEDGDHQSWVWRSEFLHMKVEAVEAEDRDLSHHHLALQGKDLCGSRGRGSFLFPPQRWLSVWGGLEKLTCHFH